MATDIAWLAGLLEGEGWFITTTYRKRGREYVYARLGVNMTDKDIIERVASMFDVAVTPQKGTRLPQYRAAVTGGKAVKWMRAIHPLMGARRRVQIEKCLRTTGCFSS